tara:strand:+ start:267 stop:923 length:657 start_codon:yes stop_codon:yes gene_type:complete
MKFTEISPYSFPSGDEIGFLSNMSTYDEKSDFVKLHEETILENEISFDAEVVNFDPIVMALDPNVVIDSSSKSIDSNKFFLLDGHHRWKFAKNKNYINKLDCILVNFSDVKIKSYAFSLNVEIDNFYNILNKSGFIKSKNQELCLYFDNEEFSNIRYQNINELYEFKKTLQDKKIILPILKESEQSNKSITFTPINPSDLITLDGLLPPKSTWITPRL